MNISYDIKESCAKINTELLNKTEEQRFVFVINEMVDRGWNFRFSIMWYSDRANARCPVNDYTEYQLLVGDFREIVETSYMIYRKEESLKELLFTRIIEAAELEDECEEWERTQ